MRALNIIVMLGLSISIAVAGFPAQAMPQCPMAAMHRTMAAKAASQETQENCDHMQMQKLQSKPQKKNGCCDDLACKMKCAAMCSAAGGLLPPSTFLAPRFSMVEKHSLVTDKVLFSCLQNSQDRPPKFLS